MPKGRFKHIQQKTNVDCGIACAAMIANASLAKATKCSSKPKKEHKVRDIKNILGKCGSGLKIGNKLYVIPNLFESNGEFQTFFEKMVASEASSFLIRTVSEPNQGHFLLYDDLSNNIKDPWYVQQISIKRFVELYYSNLKFFELYKIR